MKKRITLVLALTLVLTLVGCNNKSMDYIISNKPSVTGVVEEVLDDYVIMYSETAEGYPNGSRWSVPLDVENQDSYTDIAVGDEIVVYYDGSVMETDPLQIGIVYAITLKTPADRTTNEAGDLPPAITIFDRNYVAPYMPVDELPDGYTYIGDLSEEDANDTGLAGCKMYAVKEKDSLDDFYLYQECGTPVDENIIDTTKLQWAYVQWVVSE